MAAFMTESRPASMAPDLEGACLSDWTERMRMGHWARCAMPRSVYSRMCVFTTARGLLDALWIKKLQ